jgi:hypothetical protein
MMIEALAGRIAIEALAGRVARDCRRRRRHYAQPRHRARTNVSAD